MSDIEGEDVLGSSKNDRCRNLQFLAIVIVKQLCYIISKMTNSK